APTLAAGPRHDAREVMGAIAHQRQALAREGGDDQLAFLAVGPRRARRRIDDLDDVVVLPDVQAGARRAVDAEPGPARLGHADDVVGADRQLALDPPAQ